MVAGFEVDIKRCVFCMDSGIINGIDFSMGTAGGLVIPLADYFAAFYDDSADHGVG